jgi:hypothetical protein
MKECREEAASNGLVMATMALAFIVVAAIFFVSRSALMYRIKDFFASRRLYVDASDITSTKWKIYVFTLIFVSASSLSLMYWESLSEQAGSVVPYWLMAACFLVLLCFFYVKAWVYSLVNWVFFDSETSRSWMSGYLLLTALTAFPFYLIALLDVYGVWNHEFVIPGVILVVVVYELLLFYKLFINFPARRDGYLLNILYFCTVELLPTLVLNYGMVWVSGNVIVQNYIY